VDLRIPWRAYLLAGLAAIGLYYALPWNTLAQTLVYDGIGMSSAAAAVAAVQIHRPAMRAPWLLFAAGLACFSIGDVIFNTWGPASPSVADAFYLAGYPLLALGLAIVIRRLRTSDLRAGLLEAGIFTVGFALCQWIFVMDRLTHGPVTSGAEAVALAYPAMDVVLLSALAMLFLTPAWRTVSYRVLVGSVLLLLVADEINGFSPDTYAKASWLDSAWLLSYVLWGVAALHPSMTGLTRRASTARPRLSGPRLSLLAAGLLTAPVVLVVERATGRPLHPIAIAIGASVLSVLVLGRLTNLVFAVDRLRVEERAARSEAETAQRLLTEQNERLREADHLKDEFVALISHDLRTPLTSIMGYLELTRDDTELTDEQGRYLDIVARNSERLLRLVNDLLFVARVEAGQLELQVSELDLAAIVRQSVEEARPRAQNQEIELTSDGDGGGALEGDRGRMFQLLDNLISNALKFTPAGGRVHVQVTQRAERVRLSVSDTGVGIAPEDQKHLFDRFFRTASAIDGHVSGTGLGLYIARAIAEAHGGAISVESAQGTGTTFVVELPLARTPAIVSVAAAT
jgi:signal transduction histidine kinase